MKLVMPEFLELVTPDEALKILLDVISPVISTEIVDTTEAQGRITAEGIISPQDLPDFRRSTVDGYALKAKDTHGASDKLPAYLKIIGEVPMGGAPEFHLEGKVCSIIHTGGMLPDGANAVVMLEFTEKEGERITILKPVYPQANISQKGEDIEEGTLILEEGTYLTASKVGVLAALGRSKVKVYHQPRVAIVPTGGEVQSVGSKLERGQVYDINSYTLSSVASGNGALVTRLGIIPDTEDALTAAVTKLVNHDLIIVVSLSNNKKLNYLS